MKTASYLRIFIASATMTAIACSDPIVETGPDPNPGPPTSPVEYHTNVTTWTPGGGGTFIGLISNTPQTDLLTAAVFVVKNGQRVPINRQPYASNQPNQDMMKQQMMYNGYLWASARNNVLTLNFVGRSVASNPPFPLEVIIVY